MKTGERIATGNFTATGGSGRFVVGQGDVFTVLASDAHEVMIEDSMHGFGIADLNDVISKTYRAKWILQSAQGELREFE